MPAVTEPVHYDKHGVVGQVFETKFEFIQENGDDDDVEDNCHSSSAIMDEVYEVFSELCTELNIDGNTISDAWGTYEEVATNYTLEGDPLHWLCCALFVASRDASLNEDSDEEEDEGSSHRPSLRPHLSLHRLLQCSSSILETVDAKVMASRDLNNEVNDPDPKDERFFPGMTTTAYDKGNDGKRDVKESSVAKKSFGPVQFFSKMKRWIEMASVSKGFCDELKGIEKTFAVSKVIFEKFQWIFRDVFKQMSDQEDGPATETAAEATVPPLRRETRTYGKRPRSDGSDAGDASGGASTPTANSGAETQTTSETDSPPSEVTGANPQSSSSKTKPNLDDVRRFAWTLFVHVKSTFPAIAGDLVNSYHLMLCMIDFVFHNLVLDRRRDLLHPDFPGLPPGFSKPSAIIRARPISLPSSILEVLCDLYGGTAIEAKGVKVHYLLPFLSKMFEKLTMRGKSLNNSGVLSFDNFDFNHGVINTFHDDHVVSKGDFEERTFLDDEVVNRGEMPQPATEPSENCAAPVGIGDGPAKVDANLSAMQRDMEALTGSEDANEAAALPPEGAGAASPSASGPTPAVPMTPLTNRHLLRDKTPSCIPSTAAQNIARLKSLLAGSRPEPWPFTNEILVTAATDDGPMILQSLVMGRISVLSQTFLEKAAGPDLVGSSTSVEVFSQKTLLLAQGLYFKTLEGILKAEHKRLSKDIPALAPILEQDVLHRSLFACCLEIVLFSCSSQAKEKLMFPFVLDVCSIKPYHFYGIIELVVRTEGGLSREVVKHLNHVEESVLESIAWSPDSPVWEALEEYMASNSTHLAPSCAEVTSAKANARADLDSSEGEGSKTKLFESEKEEDLPPGSKNVTVHLQSIQDGKLVLIPVQAMMVPSPDGQGHSIRLAGKPSLSESGVKKHSALLLFYRKMYHMSSLRLRDLCVRLNIEESNMKQIWTLFEHVVRDEGSSLLRGRHLDQILLCSIYVISKVTGFGKNGQGLTFQQIMRGYRMQPQFKSHVYRSVLLSTTASQVKHIPVSTPAPESAASGLLKANEDEDEGYADGGDATEEPVSFRTSEDLPVTSSNLCDRLGMDRQCSQSRSDQIEKRGDLIQFYNLLFLGVSKNYALSLTNSHSNDDRLTSLTRLPSSHPLNIPGAQSSRRLTPHHSVFVSPIKASGCPPTPGVKMSYHFNRSPAKDLRAINIMIRRGEQRLQAALAANPKTLTNAFPVSDSPIKSRNSGDILASLSGSSNTLKSLPLGYDFKPQNIAASIASQIQESTSFTRITERNSIVNPTPPKIIRTTQSSLSENTIKMAPAEQSSATLQKQLQSLLATFPNANPETQFQIISTDGLDGIENQLLTVGGSDMVEDIPKLTHANEILDVEGLDTLHQNESAQNLQHFVTLDDGQEIHYVTSEEAHLDSQVEMMPHCVPGVPVEGHGMETTSLLDDEAPHVYATLDEQLAMATSATAKGKEQLLQYVTAVTGDEQNQLDNQDMETRQIFEQITENEEGYTTYVLQEGVDEMEGFTSCLGDDVTVLTEDGLVMDATGDGDGTEMFYQLVTAEDGTTIVTATSSS